MAGTPSTAPTSSRGSRRPTRIARHGGPSPGWGLLGLEPIGGGGEAEHAQEAGRGLLVARRDRAPFLQPGAEALDHVAVVVDEVRAGDGGLVAPGRDRGPRATGPDQLAEGVRAVAAVAHDPEWHPRQAAEQPRGQRQLVRLARGEREGDRPASPVGDDARLGAEPAPRAAERLTPVALPAGPSLLGRPRGLVVRPDAGPVEERHAELDAALLRRFQQLLPCPELGPADEQLGRPPPGAVLGRDRPPSRAVPMAPDDRSDRAPQITWRGLPLRSTRLDQRPQRRPLLVRQHHPSGPMPTRHGAASMDRPQALTGPNLPRIHLTAMAPYSPDKGMSGISM